MSEIVFNPPKSQDTTVSDLQSQIENLQTTLASLNQQVIILQEAVQEKDEEIAGLKKKLAEYDFRSVASKASPCEAKQNKRADNTLTIVGILINLYNYIILPGKTA